jgi:tocopherol cyclase
MRSINPDAFHWPAKRYPFFEGYYYKLYSVKQDRTLAFIPGVFDNGVEADRHAFLQILDSTGNRYRYLRSPAGELAPSDTVFDLRLGNSRFRLDSCALDVRRPEAEIAGTVTLSRVVPWPEMPFSRGTMGPFGYLPFLEDYHQVCALHARLSGSVTLDGEAIDFTDGYGYIEKDWGRTFPRAWIWLQSVFTDAPQSSVFLSLAEVPLGKLVFKGFLACVLFQGRPYVFATYTGATCHAAQDGGLVRIVLKSIRHRAVLTIDRSQASYIKCLAPTSGQMQPRDDESLDASISVELYRGKDLVTRLSSDRCALEVVNYFREKGRS